MSAISRSSLMAAPGRCTRPRSPKSSASAASSFRARRACSRRSACCSRICATTMCAAGSSGWKSASFDDMERIYGEIEGQGRAAIAATSVKPQEIVIARAADMRYVGQEHAVTVDLPMALFAKKDRDGIKKTFDDMHLLRYGTNAPNERAEVVSLRSTVTGVMAKPPQEKIAAGNAAPPEAAFHRRAAGVLRRNQRIRCNQYLCAHGAPRRQRDRRPCTDRRARLDHGGAARRQAHGRSVMGIC